MSRRSPVLAAVLALATAVAACSSADDGAAPTTSSRPLDLTPTSLPAEPHSAAVATRGWETVNPADVGLDPAVLDVIATEAEAAGSHCLVVVADGRIAGEWSWSEQGTTRPQEVFSVTKSVTATVAGMAIDAGELALDDPAATWIEEWAGTRSEPVTVRNLLSNDSGRFWSAESDYGGLITAGDRTAFAVGLVQAAEPGEVWAYNNAAIQTLEEVLTEATGQELPALVADRLLGPLGMADSHLATDPAGNGLAFMGLQSTCRDLARFGLMVLDGGRWGDRQVVSPDWIAASTGQPSQDLNVAYGYLWWLNRLGPLTGSASPTRADDLGPSSEGQFVPGAPEDLVWALGLGGQVVQVHPGTGTVVVRLGPPAVDGPYGPAQTARVVTEAVLIPDR